MDYCEEIRLRRVYAKLKAVDVARAAGIHPVHLSDYERGVHVPRQRTYERIIAAIDRLTHTEDSKGVMLLREKF